MKLATNIQRVRWHHPKQTDNGQTAGLPNIMLCLRNLLLPQVSQDC